jgi:hypothetical protein
MTHDTKTKIVSVERFIPAAPGLIFEILADPRQHSKIDGSGSVRDAQVSAPPRLSLGAKFAMNMKIGVPYKMTNTVVEFDDTVVDFGSLNRIVERSAMYGGFGDFRPTFGRATAEVKHV